MDDLHLILRARPPNTDFIIGGDFNMKFGSQDLKEVSALLHLEDIDLRSDPAKPTFYHAKGCSSIDHLFASTSTVCLSTAVQPKGLSDHCPISMRVKIPKSLTSKSTTTRTQQRLNVKQLTEVLENNPDLLSTDDPDTFASSFNNILKDCWKPPHRSKLRHGSNKPWFSAALHKLRQEMISLLLIAKRTQDSYYCRLYSIARKAYHAQLRLSEKLFHHNRIDELLAKTQKQGISALYKKARKVIPAPSIDVSVFLNHCRNLFCKLSDSSCERVTSCSTESHTVLDPVTPEEVCDVLKSFGSKAKSPSSLSPSNLCKIRLSLAPLLSKVFSTCLSASKFPHAWLESLLFFIHKKSSKTDPKNYRPIAIENPFLKTLTAILAKRTLAFSLANNLLPDLQFGFRPHRSAFGAASLLYEVVYKRFKEKRRTYACFVDFTQAFPSTDRSKLFVKLQLLGFPFAFCELLAHILNHLKTYVSSGPTLATPFKATNGLPQGDPISPILFNLFASDITDFLTHDGVSLNKMKIRFIQYADDLVLLANSPEDLQSAIDSLSSYCDRNNLSINISKTKCMIFYKGRCPQCSFSLNGQTLDKVNRFEYLGFLFTTQLSFSQHISHLTTKAKARCSFLFSTLPIKQLPIHLVKRIFACYIFPIFSYGSPLWLASCSNNALQSVDAVYSSYLKRYLGVPRHCNNAVTHFLCNSLPLTDTLRVGAFKQFSRLSFPDKLSGYRFSFCPSQYESKFFAVEKVPSTFWASRTFHQIPSSEKARRKLCRELLDLHHYELCSNKKFHFATADCVCSQCNILMPAYHRC